MRALPAACLLLAGLALPGGARGAGMSIGYEVLAPRTTQADCLARASQAIQAAGLRPLRPTSDAAWGENAAADQLYTIYCLADRGIAMVAGAADSSAPADAVVSRLRQALREGAAASGGGLRK